MSAYFEALLGIAIIGVAIWGAAVLLRRLMRLDTASAVLLSIVLTPLLMGGAMFLLSLLD